MTGAYIKCIEIDSLWRGTRHIVWNLQPGVNVLSGINGVGKSTILRKTIRRLTQGKEELERDYSRLGVHLTFEPEEADSVRFDVIRGIDRPLVSADILSRVSDTRLVTELDFQLYQLQRRYLDYQVNQSNRIVALFTSADPEGRPRHRPSPRRRSASSTLLTSCSRPRRRPSTARQTKSISTIWANGFRPTCSRRARNRCSSSCSRCSSRTASPMCC